MMWLFSTANSKKHVARFWRDGVTYVLASRISCAKLITKTFTASGVPVDCGPAVEQASAYWRDLGRQLLQYQLRHVRSNARQYDAAARDKLQVAIARANVASQYNMNAGVQELESFSAASFTKDQFYL